MSYTELVLFGNDGAVSRSEVFKNSHGWCPAVWDAVTVAETGARARMDESALRHTWALAEQEATAPHVRDALRCTFDHAAAKGLRNIGRLAESLREFHRTHRCYYPDGFVWHVDAMAQAMERACSEEVHVVGFYQSSIGEYPFCSTTVPCPHCGSDEYGEEREYNILNDATRLWVESVR